MISLFSGVFVDVVVVDLKLPSVSPRTNTIASHDQFKPIRIGENLVVNYNVRQFYLSTGGALGCPWSEWVKEEIYCESSLNSLLSLDKIGVV